MDKIVIKKNPKKILVIKPSSLGDVVHSLPFLNVIKDNFPHAEIHWVIAKGLEGLLETHPMLKKLWIIKKDQWKNIKNIDETILEIKNLFGELRKEEYDITIDLQGLLRSGLLTYAAKSPVRIGFKEAREGSRLFYTHKIEGCREIHAVDRYLKIASSIGCKIEDVSFPMPLIKESDYIKKLKKDIGDYAVIVPGARWKTKIWPAERFGQLAATLNIRSLLIGGQADAVLANKIETLSSGMALSLAGKTDLNDLISLMRGARYVITNDTGPMHIAAALGLQVVAIFGPTNPVRTGPYGKNNIIVTAGVSCAPCYRKSCRDMKCMNNITVKDVYKKICDYQLH
jgi:heptosyltransferase-1